MKCKLEPHSANILLQLGFEQGTYYLIFFPRTWTHLHILSKGLADYYKNVILHKNEITFLKLLMEGFAFGKTLKSLLGMLAYLMRVHGLRSRLCF